MTAAEKEVEPIARSRRVFGLINAIGLAMIFGALIYSAVQLHSLQVQKRALDAQISEERATALQLHEENRLLDEQIRSSSAILRQLNQAIAESKDKTLTAKAEVIQATALGGFKIGIYYLAGNKNGQMRAEALQQKLIAAKCPADLQLYPKPRTFFEEVQLPLADEIRYEPDYEDAQAQALLVLLKHIDPRTEYVLRSVRNRTPQFISIFMKDGF
jgi:hypothetical protein